MRSVRIQANKKVKLHLYFSGGGGLDRQAGARAPQCLCMAMRRRL